MSCPDPSVHSENGGPFRYCPYCDWTEPVPPKLSELLDARADQAYETWIQTDHEDHFFEGLSSGLREAAEMAREMKL